MKPRPTDSESALEHILAALGFLLIVVVFVLALAGMPADAAELVPVHATIAGDWSWSGIVALAVVCTVGVLQFCRHSHPGERE